MSEDREERRKDYADINAKVSVMSEAVIEIKIQLHRLVSDAISEKGTRARANEQILTQISALRDAFYGSPSGDGLTLRVDRLERSQIDPDEYDQLKLDTDRLKQQARAAVWWRKLLITAVVVQAIQAIWFWINK
jgi:hypothetical protein